MELIELSKTEDIKPFNCGDTDLNGFLTEDAIAFHNKRIGKTFLLQNENDIVAYFCLLNDKVTKIEASNGSWKKIKKLFPHNKHFSSYPAIKIGRLAVSTKYRHEGIGSKLIEIIKHSLNDSKTFSDFRFLTVDAYISAIPFYEKNSFRFLDAEDKNKHTRLMYYDMLEM